MAMLSNLDLIRRVPLFSMLTVEQAQTIADGVVKRAMRRVGGEFVATVCTLGVLVVLSMMAGFVMGRVVEPMLDTLITCFARALDYLQFVDDASTGQVALMMFSVILFLVLNLVFVFRSFYGMRITVAVPDDDDEPEGETATESA